MHRLFPGVNEDSVKMSQVTASPTPMSASTSIITVMFDCSYKEGKCVLLY